MKTSPKEFREIFIKSVENQLVDGDCSVLLSGGIDSNTTLFALLELGYEPELYTFYIDGYKSGDSKASQKVADKFGLNLNLIKVPRTNLKRDFFILAKDYKCTLKTQFECTFPFLYVFPEIVQRNVLSGCVADKWFGLSKHDQIHIIQHDDLFIRRKFELFDDGKSNLAGIKQQRMLADNYNKNLITPYFNKDVVEVLAGMTYKQANRPFQKAYLVSAFMDYFKKVSVRKHSNLQLNSKIPNLFENILNDSEINFKNRKRVMDICRDWGVRYGNK